MTVAPSPLIAFICRAPVLGEALMEALTPVADVRTFPAGRPDPEGLIRALRPDALVFDDIDEAELVAPYARAARTPLVLIACEENELRLLGTTGWDAVTHGDGLEVIRNLLVAQLFGRTRQGNHAANGERAPGPA